MTLSPIHLVVGDVELAATAAPLNRASCRSQRYASVDDFLARADLLEHGCLILDVELPGVDGPAVVRRLRRVASNIVAIILTARDDVAGAVEALKAGAGDVLAKPADAHVLLAAIERMRLAAHERPPAAAARLLMESLTPCGRETLLALVRGGLSRTMATDLGPARRGLELCRAGLLMGIAIESAARQAAAGDVWDRSNLEMFAAGLAESIAELDPRLRLLIAQRVLAYTRDLLVRPILPRGGDVLDDTLGKLHRLAGCEPATAANDRC